MRLSVAPILISLMLFGCSGPYSRSPVAAKEEQPVRVTSVRVSPQNIPEVITATGELIAEEQAIIGVRVPGRLIRLHVDLGSQVQAGQSLADIDPTDYKFRVEQSEALVTQSRARLGILDRNTDDVTPEDTAIVREAEAALKEARFIADTTAKLTHEGILSRIDFEKAQVRKQAAEAAYQGAREQVMQLRAELSERRAQLALARQNLADCTVHAPFAGAITRRQASAGEYLAINAPVVTLVRQHPVRIRVEVPERVAPRVRIGQTMEARVQGQADARVGRVVRLSPAIEAQSRSLVIEGEVPNESGVLRPGSFAEVVIVVDAKASGIAIPRNSILSFAGTDRVLIVNNGRLDDRIVRIGRSLENDTVEILSGLEPQTEIVLKPDASMNKGQKVLVR